MAIRRGLGGHHHHRHVVRHDVVQVPRDPGALLQHRASGPLQVADLLEPGDLSPRQHQPAHQQRHEDDRRDAECPAAVGMSRHRNEEQHGRRQPHLDHHRQRTGPCHRDDQHQQFDEVDHLPRVTPRREPVEEKRDRHRGTRRNRPSQKGIDPHEEQRPRGKGGDDWSKRRRNGVGQEQGSARRPRRGSR